MFCRYGSNPTGGIDEQDDTSPHFLRSLVRQRSTIPCRLDTSGWVQASQLLYVRKMWVVFDEQRKDDPAGTDLSILNRTCMYWIDIFTMPLQSVISIIDTLLHVS